MIYFNYIVVIRYNFIYIIGIISVNTVCISSPVVHVIWMHVIWMSSWLGTHSDVGYW